MARSNQFWCVCPLKFGWPYSMHICYLDSTIFPAPLTAQYFQPLPAWSSNHTLMHVAVTSRYKWHQPSFGANTVCAPENWAIWMALFYACHQDTTISSPFHCTLTPIITHMELQSNTLHGGVASRYKWIHAKTGGALENWAIWTAYSMHPCCLKVPA